MVFKFNLKLFPTFLYFIVVKLKVRKNRKFALCVKSMNTDKKLYAYAVPVLCLCCLVSMYKFI